jgi:tetratricopeptide (TPR) repeat protein
MAIAPAASPAHRPANSLFAAALAHFREGQLDLAEEACKQLLAADPQHADSLHLLGLIHAQANQLDLAIDLIAQAIRHHQQNPDYFFNLAALLARRDRVDEALKSFDIALGLKPDFVGAWIGLGDLLQRQQRLDEALLTYRHVLTLDPHSAEAAEKSGKLLYEQGRIGEAAEQFAKVVELRPDDPAAYNNLGIALTDLRRLGEATAALDRAIALSPDLAELYNSRANALKLQNRLKEALADYDRAIALTSGSAQTFSNRGNCLDELARPDEALANYQQALTLDAGHADAHWNLAINRLRAGDLRAGFREAEWRWTSKTLRLKPRHFDKPLWLGAEPIDGKVLLLHNEQGLGDAIQFARYIPLLAPCGARVVLESSPPLIPLLAGLAGISQHIAKGEALPEFDFHCPLSSLPLVLDTTLDTIPAVTPYLAVPPDARDWSSWLGENSGVRVGLVWSGNPDHLNDHNRSIAFAALAPLLDINAQFVSLQKNARAEDQRELGACAGIRDAAPQLNTFADTAALIAELDLVISVDTSVAHLAGALGKPVFILLPYVPDWRWLMGRNDTPWYPSARLFRQTAARRWEPVIAEVKDALQRFVAAPLY